MVDGEFGEQNKFCSQKIYNDNYSSTLQNKCTNAQHIFKLKDPNEGLKTYIYFT